MLHLASASDDAWLERALRNLDAILLDHAHCEKKAAGAAVKLLFTYPHFPHLQEPLSRLAREELVHFEQLLGVLAERGVAFARQRPSAYGGRLHECVRGREPQRLLDLLLVSALIEARSCERFQRLADALAGAPLGRLYGGLLESEARHHGVYVELARGVAPDGEVQLRLGELADREAEILVTPGEHPRLHS